MWMTVRDCLAHVAEYEDTPELAAKLSELAESLEPAEAYYLREAAINLSGLYELVRSMAGRLKQGAGATQATAAPATVTNSCIPRPMELSPAATQAGLIDLHRALIRAGVGRTKWLEMVKAGEAPKPLKIGNRCLWSASEVDEWLAKKMQARVHSMASPHPDQP